jgi:hypothetical protein
MNICHITDEHMRPIKIKPGIPYIHQFLSQTDEYNIIFTGPKTDEYNLNIFVSTDKFIKKLMNEWRFPVVYQNTYLNEYNTIYTILELIFHKSYIYLYLCYPLQFILLTWRYLHHQLPHHLPITKSPLYHRSHNLV